MLAQVASPVICISETAKDPRGLRAISCGVSSSGVIKKNGTPVDCSELKLELSTPSENDCGLPHAVPFEPLSWAFEMVEMVPQVVSLISHRASSCSRGSTGRRSQVTSPRRVSRAPWHWLSQRGVQADRAHRALVRGRARCPPADRSAEEEEEEEEEEDQGAHIHRAAGQPPVVARPLQRP